MKDELMIKCDCGEEILLITDDNDCAFCLAMFEKNYKYSFLNKLRFIWRIVRHGTPYEDQMCLSDESVKEIIKFLNKRLKEHK